ncbi:hypothetical protein ACFXJO_32880 [Streptomyces lavendulae]|uniref:hypothetical protein n=1 Tax=Streptomyces TaxID=1883 RepID=UPI0024767932|nr:hypothetical protein [Streptomyces sp. SPB4]
MSALKWQGWLVGLVGLAGLLVFAPLGLYVWASGGDGPAEAPPPPDVRVTACRVDPASRRVVAAVEARGTGSYVVTVEFRDREPPAPDARTARALTAMPGLTPAAPAQAEAIGPVWPPSTTPWCGIAGVAPAPPAAPSR